LVTVSTGGLVSCEDLTGQCGPDANDPGDDPTNSCLECAVLGDSTVATDGGECADEYTACWGQGDAACTGAGEPECCDLYDCVASCDANMDGFLDAGPELDCFCTNDGFQCTAQQLPGSCFGDYPDGLVVAAEWEACFFGDGVSTGVCGNLCN
jgi:hypothetical protein